MKKIQKHEKCPDCSGKRFSISTNSPHQRYCQECKAVWLPKSLLETEKDDLAARVRELEARVRRLDETIADIERAGSIGEVRDLISSVC